MGTAVPSLALLVLFIVSQNQYAGNLTLGAYMIVTPIAMVLACLAVTERHRISQADANIRRMAQLCIQPAGD